MSNAALLLALCELAVNVHIQGLGSEDFRTREASMQALKEIGPLANPALLKASEHDDPEVRWRAKHLLNHNIRANAETVATLLCGDNTPWIDMLPLDWDFYSHTAIVQDYLPLAGGAGKGPDWPNYRKATKLWITDLLKWGKPPHEVAQALEQMRAREKQWHQTNNANMRGPS